MEWEDRQDKIISVPEEQENLSGQEGARCCKKNKVVIILYSGKPRYDYQETKVYLIGLW